jgi:hypothetical protein
MSKANRQTIALLAIVSGAMHTVEHFNLDADNISIVLYAKDVCDECVKRFPCSGNEAKNQKWICDRMEEYDKELIKMVDEHYSTVLLTSMCSQIITDLTERIRDVYKLGLIEPVKEAVQALHDRIDPTGDKFSEYERADRLLDIAYKIFEF